MFLLTLCFYFMMAGFTYRSLRPEEDKYADVYCLIIIIVSIIVYTLFVLSIYPKQAPAQLKCTNLGWIFGEN